MNRDFESPIQDADIEMADLQREIGRLARLRKLGYCDHGWYQGPPGPAGNPTSVFTCHHCGKVFKTEAELIEDGRENTL